MSDASGGAWTSPSSAASAQGRAGSRQLPRIIDFADDGGNPGSLLVGTPDSILRIGPLETDAMMGRNVVGLGCVAGRYCQLTCYEPCKQSQRGAHKKSHTHPPYCANDPGRRLEIPT